MDVIRHEPRVALLSSTPFYHWRKTAENNSSSTDGTRLDYSGDPEYWPYLDKLFQLVVGVAEPAIRNELLAQNVHVRLVSQLGQRASGTDDAGVTQARAEVARMLEAYVPAELDLLLPERSRSRSPSSAPATRTRRPTSCATASTASPTSPSLRSTTPVTAASR